MTKIPIIATGISGLVGSRIVELLGHKYSFISFSLDSGIDITNLNLLTQAFKKYEEAKIVLHLAAFTDVDAAFLQTGDKNGLCYKVNVLGSKNIARLCRKTNKYLISISTDFVFDGKNPPIGGYKEEDLPSPLEWYGKTKLLAEKEIIFSGCRSVILRIAFPFKAKPAKKELEPIVKLDLVRKIIAKLKNQEKLTMFSDQIITPTFIDDFAKVIDKCIRFQPKGIFHCVGSESLSPYELAKKIANTFEFNKKLIKKTTLEEIVKKNSQARPRQKNNSLSNFKLEKELGIKMLNVDKALQKMKEQL